MIIYLTLIFATILYTWSRDCLITLCLLYVHAETIMGAAIFRFADGFVIEIHTDTDRPFFYKQDRLRG